MSYASQIVYDCNSKPYLQIVCPKCGTRLGETTAAETVVITCKKCKSEVISHVKYLGPDNTGAMPSKDGSGKDNGKAWEVTSVDKRNFAMAKFSTALVSNVNF